MSRESGGPAFPCDWHETSKGMNRPMSSRGMTLRDWFAGQALQGLLANPALAYPPEHCAVVAGQYADAMIAERQQS